MICASCGTALTADHLFCPRCGTRVPEAAAEAVPPHTDTAVLLDRALGASYKVGALIGRGGFGEVYAAEDRSLKRTVAIKVLRVDVADSRTAIDRFRREAEALGRLRHPHIMPVFGIGEGEGLTYFVMPHIEGESLADLVARGEQLPLADACRVIAETGDALAAAHRAGVVHRDIKPDNILLEGVERHALLMDFGIAKSGGAEGRLTATGMIIGTPMYMSPEQATGDHIGSASDIYSLGVVAYELLAGRPIFGRDTSPQHVVAAHLAQVPDDLRAVNPAVPSAIAKAVMRCLRKDPAARWPAVADFVQALNRARADLPREPEVVIPEAPPPLSKRGRLIVAALGVVGAATTFAVYSTAKPTLDAPRMSREMALADAESVLAVLGLPRYRDRAWEFTPGSWTRRFLEGRPGAPPTPASLSRVPLGRWHFAFYSPGTSGYVRVSMGGPGWASSFERKLDSAAARRQPLDTVLTIPVSSALRALGWDPDSLRLADSSRVLTEDRLEETYHWTAAGAAGLVVGTDTAKRRVEATFTNGRLTTYSTTVSFPPAVNGRDARRVALGDLTWPVVLALLIAVLVVDLIFLRRRSELRFERALRVATATALLFVVSFAFQLRTGGSFGGPFSYGFHPERFVPGQVLSEVMLALLFGAGVFVASSALFAACEAFALRRGLNVLAGWEVLASRPRLPRIAGPLPVGVALGLVMAGAGAAAAAVTARLTSTPLPAGQGWTQTPLASAVDIGVLVSFVPALVALGTLLLLHLGAVGRIRRVVPGALFVGVATGVIAAFTTSGIISTQQAVTLGTLGAGLALIVVRRGMVEAMVALIVARLALSAAQVWRAPYSDPWPVTIALGLLVVAAVAATLVPAKPARGAGSRASAAP